MAVVLRVSFALTCLALICSVRAQDVEKTLDYGPVTANIKRIAAELEKASGVKLEIYGTLQREILFVDAKHVTLHQLMDRIAQATDAQWTKERETYRLERPGPVVTAQERKEFENRVARVVTYRDRSVEEVSKQAPWNADSPVKVAESIINTLTRLSTEPAKDTDYKLVEDLSKQQPINRTLLRLVASIDPADLATLGPDERVVYATNPKRSQKAMPSRSLAVLEAGIRENSNYLNAIYALQPASNVRQYGFNSLRLPPPLKGNAASLGRALLSIDRWGSGNQFQVHLSVNDSQGEEVASQDYTIFLPQIPMRASTVRLDDAKNSKFDIGEETKDILRAYAITSEASGSGGEYYQSRSLSDGSYVTFSNYSPTKGITHLSESTIAKIQDPVTYEPLGYAFNDIFTTIAKRTSENIVALLPDSSFYPTIWNLINRDFTPNQFFAFSRDSIGLEPIHEGGWFLFKPMEPALARADSINRDALRTLLRTAISEDGISLKALSSFLLNQTHEPSAYSFDGAWLMFLRPMDGGPAVKELGRNARLLRVLGSFVNAQGSLPSVPVRLAALTTSQSRYLQAYLGSMSTPWTVDLTTVQSATTQLGRDKSELIPNGPPGDGFIEFTTSDQPGLVGYDSTSNTKRYLSIRQFAQLKVLGETPSLVSQYGQPQEFQKFQPAQMSIFDMKVTLRPGVTVSGTYQNALPRVQGKPVPFADLPQALQKAIDEDIKRIKGY